MRNGWIMLMVLICVAFLVSCGKKENAVTQRGELVQAEVREIFPGLSLFCVTGNYPILFYEDSAFL